MPIASATNREVFRGSSDMKFLKYSMVLHAGGNPVFDGGGVDAESKLPTA